MTHHLPISNPLAGNPLENRADVERALRDLLRPLQPFSPASGAAHPGLAVAGLEGFASLLWGLAPLAAGGRADVEHWERVREGLSSGTDPSHPRYWGPLASVDRRLVGLAAIGFALRLVPHLLWDPLPEHAKRNLSAWLLQVRALGDVGSHWAFCRIMLDLGLEQIGFESDRSSTRRCLGELDAFHLGDGWYRDGRQRVVDHHIPFAMQFYGLVYSRLQSGDEERAERYRDRARRFAQDIRHWFDEEGGALVWGRSPAYRFASADFWAALAFADLEALDWGEVKGHLLRHLRWWSTRPIADPNGVLSIGCAYPNPVARESDGGSPYLALIAFLPLALPESHPFWQGMEQPAPSASEAVPLRHAGMVLFRTPGNLVALSSGQESPRMESGSERYGKFAYASRYGFSIENGEQDYRNAALDGMLGLSDDDSHFRVRVTNGEALIAGECLYALWKPWNDVIVETWLVPEAPWHMRVHRVTTPRPLHATEGGFAIARTNADCVEELGLASARGNNDISVIVDIAEGGPRRAGHAHKAPPGTNLLAPLAIVPQLRGRIPAGTTILAAAILALPAGTDAEKAAARPPEAPSLFALEALFKVKGRRVTAFDIQASG